MPVRDARDSLRTAVASVLAQTLTDWELVIVHDDDGTGLEWLDRLGDRRIRVMHNDFESGRGGARQTALSASLGQYIAFLDADDWMFPQRLALQAQALDLEPDLALVSAGMIVVDENEQPVGARKFPRGADRSHLHPEMPPDSPVLNASSMLRGELARGISYDTKLGSGEDSDFLSRFLVGRRFRQEDFPLYCYREFASFTSEGLRAALAARTARHLRRLDEGQGSTVRRLNIRFGAFVRSTIYSTALVIGGKRLVLKQRCRPMKASEQREFEIARHAVAQIREQITSCTA